MMNLSCKVLSVLKGKTLVTAESCTGGGIGTALTAVPGSSSVYKGGVVCYSNWVKQNILGVREETLKGLGPVSESVAQQMASGIRKLLQADVAVSVTGLAGPDADEFGYPVGTVFIGYEDDRGREVRSFHFSGNRESVRHQTIEAALHIILENN